MVPAQHYLCGGIVVDKNGKTSINNLFACGECSQTGLHGANRLASNSLLEALVYSDKIYEYLAHEPINESNSKITILDWERIEKPMIDPKYISEFKSKLQLLMRQNAGIVRNDTDLLKAKEQLSKWQIEIDTICRNYQITKASYELKNMIAIGTLIVLQSIESNENRGGFVKINT